MQQKIKAVFINRDNPKFFAETCMYELKIPTVHDALENLKAAFMEACAHSRGFGAV